MLVFSLFTRELRKHPVNCSCVTMTTHVEHRYSEGSIYRGYVDSEGLREGFGILILSDGSRFRGHFQHGFFAGVGIINFPDGSRYEGDFQQGKFDGYGTFYRNDGMVYEGQFKDGSMHGLGLVTFPDGCHGLPRNEGFFENERLVRREKCSRTIQRARQVAGKAREQCA
ncbi:MORN repeat-containing protein 4 [Plakobranchus ocellatus]|uniref:MORN repeat-containing protein 4 n=1 Tax=Plakobranchus ocellatus TaxID=259542 RepID=A0AAV4E1X2_9GAST|nr:MORN repeat-containing protein 4 [Plakobranchus ocellatus]